MADAMLGNAPLRNEIFAGNRTVGRIAFTVVSSTAGRSRPFTLARRASAVMRCATIAECGDTRS